MKKFLKKIKNLIRRFDLIDECKRLKKAGRFLPENYKNLIFKQPSRYDDFVNILCFIDNNKETNLVDIGANVGEFTKDFLEFFPHTKSIILFEPLKHLNDQIKNNLSGYKFELINKAVGNKNELDSISYKIKETKMASLKKYVNLENNKDLESDNFDKNNIVNENIEVVRLDDFEILARKQYVLKIDVQGFELDVIQGASKCLNYFDLVILECSFAKQYENTDPSFSKIVELLEKSSLYPVIFQTYGDKISTYAFERDVIFVKKELLDKIFYKNYYNIK